MSLTNRYAPNSYPAETVTALDTNITALLATTADFPSQDVAIMKHLAKMGLQSESFATEALQLAKSNPDLMPRGLDVPRMQRALANRELLMERLVDLIKIQERVHAAIILHGVDALSDGLVVYNTLQRNGTDTTLREAVARLGRLFKKNGLRNPATVGGGTGTGAGSGSGSGSGTGTGSGTSTSTPVA